MTATSSSGLNADARNSPETGHHRTSTSLHCSNGLAPVLIGAAMTRLWSPSRLAWACPLQCTARQLVQGRMSSLQHSDASFSTSFCIVQTELTAWAGGTRNIGVPRGAKLCPCRYGHANGPWWPLVDLNMDGPCDLIFVSPYSSSVRWSR